MNQKNLQAVDWSKIPAPVDDGMADHLKGCSMPDLALPSTSGDEVYLNALKGWTVIYCYPMTGRPDTPLPDGWDDIPGARGCTPQSCSYRDHFRELSDCGVSEIYGISTQRTKYQKEAVNRLHLPFALLSDNNLKLAGALRLPTMMVNKVPLLKRMTLILRGPIIERVVYPVFPPDQDARHVLNIFPIR